MAIARRRVPDLFSIPHLLSSHFPQISMVKIGQEQIVHESSSLFSFPSTGLESHSLSTGLYGQEWRSPHHIFIPSYSPTVFPLLRHRIKETSSFPFIGERLCSWSARLSCLNSFLSSLIPLICFFSHTFFFLSFLPSILTGNRAIHCLILCSWIPSIPLETVHLFSKFILFEAWKCNEVQVGAVDSECEENRERERKRKRNREFQEERWKRVWSM